MALEPNVSAAFDFAIQVDRFYAGLNLAAGSDLRTDPGAEPSLGGKLLYAGELDVEGRVLAVAGNIAGAATLAATADAAAQKQAFRDGVVDFLVTSLDEALRILKNQIRKRETVAVCVADAPAAVEGAMLERGVLPDLLQLGSAASSAFAGLHRLLLKNGTTHVEPVAAGENQAIVTWSIAAAPAIWMPKLDAIAFDCLRLDSSPAAWSTRRWLRLAPRYLGRLAQGVRLMRCNEQTALRFLERVERAELEVPAEVQLHVRGESMVYRFSPSKSSDSAIAKPE